MRTYDEYMEILERRGILRSELDQVASELGITDSDTRSLKDLVIELKKRVEERKDKLNITSSQTIDIREIVEQVTQKAMPLFREQAEELKTQVSESIDELANNATVELNRALGSIRDAARKAESAEEEVTRRVLERISIQAGRSNGGDKVALDGPIEVSVDDIEMLSQAVPATLESYINPYPEHTDRWNAMLNDGHMLNVALKGPTGSGKTTFAQQFAARYNRPCYILDCGVLVEPDQFFGAPYARDGTTGFRLSDFMRMLPQPGAVLVADEYNRTAHPKVNNAGMSIMDWRHYADVPEYGRIHRGKGTIIFATFNEGHQYVGTDVTDLAHAGRFHETLTISYLPPEEEVNVVMMNTGLDKAACQKIVKLAASVRSNFDAISPRTLIATAQAMVYGATFQDAAIACFSGITGEAVIAEMVAAITGTERGPRSR